jgi:hypothetical protein
MFKDKVLGGCFNHIQSQGSVLQFSFGEEVEGVAMAFAKRVP